MTEERTLLQAVEALMAEIQGLRSDMSARRQNDVSDKVRREKAMQRQRRYVAKKKSASDVKMTSAPQVVSITSKDQEKKIKTPAADVSATSQGDHRRLVEYGTKAIETAIGRKYPFDGKKDGRHAKDLLEKFGLASAQRAFDLSAQRFQREDFWRSKGLTFGMVVQAAQALLTAPASAPNGARGALHVDNEKHRAEAPGRKML